MIRVRLFGVPAIEQDGSLLTGRATQRHRLALLALLALSPGNRLSRDRLIATLWPESDQERGRNLLKVATYVLRSTLGDDALISAGDELRLSTDLIAIDVAEFEDALQRSDHARAIEAYQGPLLDGFFLNDAPEFEHWVDGERARLAARFATALEAAADAAAAAGDAATALRWWKARAAHDPYDTRVALRLMHAYEASGNRAGALQHAAIHARLLQEEFGMDAAPEVAALAERLRQEPVAVAARPPHSEPAAIQLVEQAGAAGPTPALSLPPAARPRAGRWAAGLVLVGAVAVAGAVTVWPRTPDPQQSIVVLPFVNMSGDQDNEYFSDGLTEEIITRLAAVPGLKVISRTSAMHYKGTTKILPQIARELNVDHILEGSVRYDSGRVRISAQLIDARVDGHIWADNYDDYSRDELRAQEQIAHEVVRALELRLAARTRRLLEKQSTHDTLAYQLYQRGRYAWNTRTREGHARAIEYFQRAIARDSAFADAHASLAHAYRTGFLLNLDSLSEAEVYERSIRATERALALDDESADAHIALAVTLQWQRNWPEADREFLRAIELSPGSAVARTWYSLLLRGMGRHDDALQESRRAAELDPFGVVSLHNYGLQCYIMRDYECAQEQFERTLEVLPYPGAVRGLAMVHAQQGRWTDAIAAAHEAVALAPERPDFLADLAFVLARAGNTDSARVVLRRVKHHAFEPFNIGRAHVALGEADSAFVWLERSNWEWPHRAYRADPALDPLRGDPRFQQLSDRVDRAMRMH
jgi:TolB-like protein/DNA-binding SARP family transcriptional activator/Flp pilus assembly protein TadD